VTKDFFSFERVLRELQMEEEELKRLVSEGEIRAFRDEDKMRFRKEDIARFQRMSGDTQDTLGDEDIPEELVFDEDDADQEVGMATAAIDDAFLEEDDPLELEDAPAPPSGGRQAKARPSPARPKPRVLVEEEEKTEGPAWVGAFVLVALVLAFGGFFAADAHRSQAGQGPGPLTEGFADWVDETFMNGPPSSDQLKVYDGTPEGADSIRNRKTS